jgi:hypothetical protein
VRRRLEGNRKLEMSIFDVAAHNLEGVLE